MEEWRLTMSTEEEDGREQGEEGDHSEVHGSCCMGTPAKGNEERYLRYREINTPMHPSLGEEQY